MSGRDCKRHKYFSVLKHLQVGVEQLRVMDKGFSSGNPVSIFENCGGDLCGGGVGKRGWAWVYGGARRG